MRLSKFPLHTSKETPSDAEVVSHQLMLRAGFVRKLGAGLYTWMPIGLRVLQKISTIVREEMNRAGAMEVFMPSVQPADIWQESGRWEKMGSELLRLKDRHDRDFCYGPTHEEVICHTFRQDYKSYKQLPVNFYQIQTKFRDEIRPRFGLMRGREFLMKDAYSFHIDESGLAAEYANMRNAYSNIFQRVGVDFRIVKADSGNIGGKQSEEFHVLAQSGEDTLAVNNTGSYAANIEAAETVSVGTPSAAQREMEKLATPDVKSCEQVAKHLNVSLYKVMKSLVVKGVDDPWVMVVLRGDYELNPLKAEKHPNIAIPCQLATESEVLQVMSAATGVVGPVNSPIPVIADFSAAAMSDFVCGANQADSHFSGVNWNRDVPAADAFDLRMIEEGDVSPDGEGHVKLVKGIEVGHIFQLGDRYTRAMNISVLDANGKDLVPLMGCYGIGVSRVAAAVIEQMHDDRGMIWPTSVAPFTLVITPIGYEKSDATKAAADSLYSDLLAAGVDVLLDDRGLRPGNMFADAELIGIPHRLVIGDKGLANNQFEYVRRGGEGPQMIENTTQAVLAKLA